MSEETTVKKSNHRGRQKGSVAVAYVTIDQLAKYVPGTTVIEVRRKWLETLEKFHNVSFSGEPKPEIVKEVLTVEVAQEESASAADAAIRVRVPIVEEDLD